MRDDVVVIPKKSTEKPEQKPKQVYSLIPNPHCEALEQLQLQYMGISLF